MPIPAFNADGLLPEGLHDCSIADIRERFGQFETTDIRCRLFERLEHFIREVKSSGLVAAVIIDGSFVTAADDPHDVDLIAVVRAGHDFAAILRPFEYNVISRRRVSREFGFDMLLAEQGQIDLEEAIAFFSQVRDRPNVRKGLLKITL